MDPISSTHAKQNAKEIIDRFLAGGLPKEGTPVELPAAVAEILAGASLRLGAPANALKDVDGQLSIPEPDEADLPRASAVDLAKLAALVKLDNEKYQLKVKKSCIEQQNSEIEAQSAERRAKLEKTLKDMDKAARMGLFMKIFGWLMVGLSLLMAGLTCGAAGGLVVGAVAGAVAATTLQILNQTGVMEKLTKAFAEGLKKNGCPDQLAEILAAVFTALIEIGVGLGASFGSAWAAGKSFGKLVKAGVSAGMTLEQATAAAARQTILRTAEMAAKAMERIFKFMPSIMKGVEWGFKAIGLGSQIASAEISWEYATSKSEETRAKALLRKLMQQQEQLMDEMNEVIEQLMNGDAVVAKLLLGSDQVSNEIAERTARMA